MSIDAMPNLEQATPAALSRFTVDELRTGVEFILWRRGTASAVNADFAEFAAAERGLSGRGLPEKAPTVPVVQVRAAHGGAGASVVSLALAEGAADLLGTPVRLVCPGQPGSGLTCAAREESGPDGTGWLLGQRGLVEVDRRDPEHLASPVTSLRPADGVSAVIVDVGTGPVLTRDGVATVLVARSGSAGLRAVEALLTRDTDLTDPAIALVGLTRVSRSLGRAFPRLGRAITYERVMPMPWCRRLDGAGIGPEPLPAALRMAARTVWTTTQSPPVTASEHPRPQGDSA